MKGYKVPFRNVICESFKDCVRQTIWCHIVIKIFPNSIDFNSSPLIDHMLKSPKNFYHQLEFMLIAAKEHNDKLMEKHK